MAVYRWSSHKNDCIDGGSLISHIRDLQVSDVQTVDTEWATQSPDDTKTQRRALE